MFVFATVCVLRELARFCVCAVANMCAVALMCVCARLYVCVSVVFCNLKPLLGFVIVRMCVFPLMSAGFR